MCRNTSLAIENTPSPKLPGAMADSPLSSERTNNNNNNNINEDNGISIRCRTRKSFKAIDPEFGCCQETVVSFGSCGESSRKELPCLILTPVPVHPLRAISPLRAVCPLPTARPSSFGNTDDCGVSSSGGRGSAPMKRRNQSIGSLGDEITGSWEGSNKGGDYGGDGNPTGQGDLGHREGLPPKQQHNKSSIPLTRIPSTARSEPGIFNELNKSNHSTQSQARSTAQTASMSHDSRSRSLSRPRSRSRSRSRTGNGAFLRKRSIGARNAFADVPLNGGIPDPISHSAHSLGGDGIDDSIRSGAGSVNPSNLKRGTSIGSLASMEREESEPIRITVKDVIFVDQDIIDNNSPSSSLNGSCNSPPSATASNAIPPPPLFSSNGILPRKNSLQSSHKHCLFRIFINTFSHGYIEFSFDNSNCYEILLAFLRAHLKEKIRDRTTREIGTGSAAVGHSGAMQTMVLTPSKLDQFTQPPLQYSLSFQPTTNTPKHHAQFSRSNSNLTSRTAQTSPSNQEVTFDKLEAKAIKQRLKQESTPLERMKDNLAEWMSHIVDCGCCQDTTAVTQEDDASASAHWSKSNNSNNGRGGYVVLKKGSLSPMTEKLRKQGIGTLSLEEDDASSGRGVRTNLAPKLSFEPSVGSKGSKR